MLYRHLHVHVHVCKWLYLFLDWVYVNVYIILNYLCLCFYTLYCSGGSIPWARVAQELGGRTDAMCSTRWRNLSSTPEVVQQYASRVAEKVLTKKSNLSPKASQLMQALFTRYTYMYMN